MTKNEESKLVFELITDLYCGHKEYLIKTSPRLNPFGKVVWFDSSKEYGFIATENFGWLSYTETKEIADFLRKQNELEKDPDRRWKERLRIIKEKVKELEKELEISDE